MRRMVPHLWYDKEAGEAADFYTKTFKNSSIKSRTTIDNTPSGSVEILTIELEGQEFMMISAGPYFKFTPAASFLVACETKEEVERLWGKLSEGGKALMELAAYPFSEKYGWLEDRYGLSWQLMYSGARKVRRKITPTLMFTGENCGKAEEAMQFYTSIFSDSKVGEITRYGPGLEPDAADGISHGEFTLDGNDYSVMDSAYEHGFTFNEAVSLMVYCDTQEEIDHFWDRLSAVPEAEQCGWLKDRYGLSWQIVPTIMNEMMGDKDPAKSARVTEAFLKMKKFDIAELKKAYEG